MVYQGMGGGQEDGPRNDPRNCMPLCARCHRDVHELRIRWDNALTEEERAYVELIAPGYVERRHRTLDARSYIR